LDYAILFSTRNVVVNVTVREFVAFSFKILYKKFAIRLAIWGLQAHSTGCSGAVARLISVATDWCLTAWVHVNLGQQTYFWLLIAYVN